VANTTRKKILRLLENSKDKAFIRKEFAPFGTGRQVACALSQLVDEGSLIRAGQSIWVKARKMISPFKRNYGEILITAETDAIGTGLQALSKMGYKVSHSKLKIAQLEKRSTQIPIGIKIRILDGKKERKIIVNNQRLEYEKD